MATFRSNLTYIKTNLVRESNTNATSAMFYEGIAWCATFGVESLAILISNLLTIAAFATKKCLRKRGTYLLINLAIADVFVGLVPVPLYIYFIGAQFQLWSVVQDGTLLYVFYLLDILLGVASLGNLTIIALERVFAALRPFRYRTLQPRSYHTTIAVAWALAFLVASVCFSAFYLSSRLIISTYISMIVVFIAFVVICSSYAIVWGKLKLHRRDDYRKGSDRNDRKLGITMIILTILSLTAWLPFVILNLVVVFAKISSPSLTVVLATKLLHYGNSLVNCLIYTLRMPDFRKAVLKLLCNSTEISSPAESTASQCHHPRRTGTFSNCSLSPSLKMETRPKQSKQESK